MASALNVGDVLKTSGFSFSMPKFSSGAVIKVGLIIVLALVVACIIGYIVYWYMTRRKYSLTLKIFRQYGKAVRMYKTDRGWLKKIGLAGDTWIHFKRMKTIKERPVYWITDTEVWYFLRQDGELINFGLEEFDESMQNAGCKYVSQDMRLSRIATEKILKEEYKTKQGFWDRYGQTIMIIMFALIFIIGFVIVIKSMKEPLAQANLVNQQTMVLAEKSLQNQEAMNKNTEAMYDLINVQYSGLKKVNTGGGTT